MKTKKTFNITMAILLGLVLGIMFGLFMPGRYEFALPVVELVSSLYMNALRMMIYPLVFCSLVVGIQGIGSVSSTGKIGGQSVLYYAGTTLFASTLGLFLPKMLGLGKGVSIQMVESNVEAAKFTSLIDTVKELIPSNPVASFANGDMLQVLVFAIIVGSACLTLGKKAEPVVKFCEALNEVCVKVVSWVMYCTPVGVFCSIAAVMYANGIETMIAFGPGADRPVSDLLPVYSADLRRNCQIYWKISPGQILQDDPSCGSECLWNLLQLCYAAYQ